MISVEEALARVLALAPPPGAETVTLREAAGRVLIAPAVALRDQPPFDGSSMDGYAVRAADLGAGPLRIAGEAAAGRRHPGALGPGGAVRIFTGAPLPEGADQVVPQEAAQCDGAQVTLDAGPQPGAFIRPLGQDFRAGETVAAPRRLAPRDLALLAAMNLAEIRVARRPMVAIIATGDELVPPGGAPGPDQIISANSHALAAMAEAAGAEARILPIARDSEASLRFTFGLAAGADLILTSGGASVGAHDLVGQVAADLGMERAFWKIAMRPGKPLMAGRMGEAVLLGLPGNPVSALVCAQLFLLPLLARMQGLDAPPAPRPARLQGALGPTGVRADYLRARLLPGEDGLPGIAPLPRQDSALLRDFAEADALLIRPANDGPVADGARVRYLPL